MQYIRYGLCPTMQYGGIGRTYNICHANDLCTYCRLMYGTFICIHIFITLRTVFAIVKRLLYIWWSYVLWYGVCFHILFFGAHTIRLRSSYVWQVHMCPYLHCCTNHTICLCCTYGLRCTVHRIGTVFAIHTVVVSMVVLGMVPMLLPQLWSLPYGTISNILQGTVGDVSYIWYVCMCIFSLPYTCGLCSTSTVRTYLYIRSLPYIQWSYVWYVQYVCVHNFIALPYPCRYIRYGIQVRTYVRTICTVSVVNFNFRLTVSDI